MNFALLLTFKLTFFWLYFRRSCKTTLFRKPTEVSQNTSTSYQYGHPLRNTGPLKIWKICVFFGDFFFKKILLIFAIFDGSDIWAKVYHIWKSEVSLGPLKLLLHFIEYPLDQLNSKHTKTVANSTIQYFEDSSRKKCLLKFDTFWYTKDV